MNEDTPQSEKEKRKTYPVLMLVEPCHEWEHIPCQARHKTDPEECMPHRWMAPKAVVHDRAHTRANQPEERKKEKEIRIRCRSVDMALITEVGDSEWTGERLYIMERTRTTQSQHNLSAHIAQRCGGPRSLTSYARLRCSKDT